MGTRTIHVTAAVAVAIGFAACDWALGLHKFPPGSGSDVGDGGTSAMLVQQATAGSAATRGLSGSFDTPPVAGHVVVIIGAAVNRDLDTPTGGGVTTWTQVASSVHNTNVEMWIGVVDTAISPVTITCSKCTATEQMWMLLTEWSGLMTGNLVEDHQDMSGIGSGSNTATTAPVATLHAPDLLIFGVSGTANMGTDIDGWTPLTVVKDDIITQSAWYRVTQAPGSYSASVTVVGIWDAVLGAVRANK